MPPLLEQDEVAISCETDRGEVGAKRSPETEGRVEGDRHIGDEGVVDQQRRGSPPGLQSFAALPQVAPADDEEDGPGPDDDRGHVA
jgi:hypothetical protein